MRLESIDPFVAKCPNNVTLQIVSASDLLAHYKAKNTRLRPPPVKLLPQPIAEPELPRCVPARNVTLAERIAMIVARVSELPPAPSRLRSITTITAECFSVGRSELYSPSRTNRVVLPRQIAMTIARRFTSRSLPEIGRHFRRDHTTVLYAVKKQGAVVEAAISGSAA